MSIDPYRIYNIADIVIRIKQIVEGTAIKCVLFSPTDILGTMDIEETKEQTLRPENYFLGQQLLFKMTKAVEGSKTINAFGILPDPFLGTALLENIERYLTKIGTPLYLLDVRVGLTLYKVNAVLFGSYCNDDSFIFDKIGKHTKPFFADSPHTLRYLILPGEEGGVLKGLGEDSSLLKIKKRIAETDQEFEERKEKFLFLLKHQHPELLKYYESV